MTSAATIGLINGLMWLLLFYFAVRHRRPLSLLVVLGAWATNYLLGAGLILEGNLNRTWVTALIVYLLIDRLDKRPEHVKHLAAMHVEDTRRRMHWLESDRASWEARATAYKRLLEQHGINH